MTELSKCRGIVPVLQTPFDAKGAIAWHELIGLVEDGIEAGASAFLAPAVASEVSTLSKPERQELMEQVANACRNRVGFIVGASSPNAEESRHFVRAAESIDATACLISAPTDRIHDADALLEYFRTATMGTNLPLLIQDLDWNGFGLPLEVMARLRANLPTLAGFKIEIVPAGPKYTAVRRLFGPSIHISGGWAVPQMIEALDRGVDAMIPEASMVRIYVAIQKRYMEGKRNEAVRLFRSLLPILAFSNQEIQTSIAFFKRLLVRRGIFTSETMRTAAFEWDEFNRRIADELIDGYESLESELTPE